jgi:hypothetical protein
MGPQQPTNQNIFLKDTPLESKFLDPDYLFGQGSGVVKDIYIDIVNNWSDIIGTLNTFLFFASMFFLIVISYTVIRLMEIRKKEHRHLQEEIAEYAHHRAERMAKSEAEQAISRNPRWIKTLDYLVSHSEGDWKLAIVEADSMLEGLLIDLGFEGKTLGERLKSATQERFRHLTSAWEVHTIRNRIAHEGSSFILTLREAKRVIAIYEDIFREFGYI